MVLTLFRSAYQFEGSVVSREKRTEAETELNWQSKTETRKHQTLSIHKPLVEKQARLQTGAGDLPDHHDHHVPTLRPGHQAHRGLLPPLVVSAVHQCALLAGGQ